jgi:hypothetical protein
VTRDGAAPLSYITTDAADAARLKQDLIPSATYKRRTTTLKPEESERIERLARVMSLAEQHRYQSSPFGRSSAPARRIVSSGMG